MEDFITRSSEEYKELRKTAFQALKAVNRLIDEYRPSIFHEVYLTGEEVREMFRISQRSLHPYRDERIIPYTTIGGKFLYPRPRIFDVLERNYTIALIMSTGPGGLSSSWLFCRAIGQADQSSANAFTVACSERSQSRSIISRKAV